MEDREFFLVRLNQTLNAYKEVQKIIFLYKEELISIKESILKHLDQIDVNTENRKKEMIEDFNNTTKKLESMEIKINSIQDLANKMVMGVNILKWTFWTATTLLTIIGGMIQFGLIHITYGIVK